MKKQAIVAGGLFLTSLTSGNPAPIPCLRIDAPVVHWQNLHVLHQGQTSIVLDGSKGLSVLMMGESSSTKALGERFRVYLRNASLKVELEQKGKRIVLDQAYDSQARLEILSQEPTRVAARAYFKMCSQEGGRRSEQELSIFMFIQTGFILSPAFSLTGRGLPRASPGRACLLQRIKNSIL